MIIKRDKYLNQIIERKDNGLIKIITGLRRCGKSFLLNNLYKRYLISSGVEEEQIIQFSFDSFDDVMKLDKYWPNEETLKYVSKNNYLVNPKKFVSYINDLTKKENDYYLLLDEIQLLDNFVMVLNGFLHRLNFDVYVTGNNSKMLSSDIITEFRGRGDQIHLYPLSFNEFFEATSLSFDEAYLEYQYFGGMPYLLNIKNEKDKQEYLKRLFSEIYIKDIVERNNIKDVDSFEKLFFVLSSSIGSYTNPTKLENTFKSAEKIAYGHVAIKKHIDLIRDSFILSETLRYDVKGKNISDQIQSTILLILDYEMHLLILDKPNQLTLWNTLFITNLLLEVIKLMLELLK